MKALPVQTRRTTYVFVALVGVSLAITALQFIFRRFDDNNLMSWNLVFMAAEPIRFFLVLATGLSIAAIVVRFYSPHSSRSLLLFSGCFVTALCFWGTPEVQVDASRYFTQAKYIELFGIQYFWSEWGRSISAWTDLPAIPFTYGMIFRIFGEHRIFIQMLNAVCFASTAVVTSLIGKELFDEETGGVAGALLLGIPYLLIMTPLMLVDVATMFFLSLTVYLYIRGVTTGGGWRIVGAGAAGCITALCKYSAWPMLSILVVITVVYYFRSASGLRRRILERSFGMLMIIALLSGIFIVFNYDVVAGQIDLLLSFQRPSLGRQAESLLSIFLYQIHPIITIAALVSLFVALYKRDLNYVIVAWLWCLMFLFHLRRVRYALPAFPLLALMAAYGLQAVKDQAIKNMIVAGTLIMSLATGVFAYLPYTKQFSAMNIQQAGGFLSSLDVDTIEVVVQPEKEYSINPAVFVPLLDLYADKKIVYNYEAGASTPDEDYRQSALRFSWEYKNPVFYSQEGTHALGRKAVVLISSSTDPALPGSLQDKISEYHQTKTFATAFPFFSYQSIVRVVW